MNRRQFLSTALAAPLAVAQPRKPNIVLILADDLGYEALACNGGTSYKTPNLDRLAQRGVRFTHAYAQPLCTPTRLQLMTGLYNNRNWKAFGVMEPHTTTFGHRLQKLGYKTCIAGKWQLYSYNPPDFEPEWRGKGMVPQDGGFDEYCLWHSFHTEDKGSRYGDPTMFVNGKLEKNLKDQFGDDIFSKFLMDSMERNRDKPFFAYYPMALTHGPFMATPRSKDWNTARLKNDTKHFPDMVEYMDEVVGRVVDKIDALGIAENTLVVFYSDNGTDRSITSKMGDREVRGGKGLPTDAGTRVPMIARWGSKSPQGRVCDDLVDSTDFLPTMFEAVGAKLPSDLPFDGRSFLPQVLGKRGKPREWTYCWHDPRPGHGKEEYTKLVRYARDQRWKLYDDGRMFDVDNDVLEQKAVPGPAAVRKKLQAVLDRKDLKDHL